MSVSLYYTVERKVKLTDEEIALVDGIVESYNDGFLFSDESESFGFFPAPYDDGVVLLGSVKIGGGDSSPDDAIEVLTYWCACLTELRYAIAADAWHVHLDDLEVPWVEGFGYGFEAIQASSEGSSS